MVEHVLLATNAANANYNNNISQTNNNKHNSNINSGNKGSNQSYYTGGKEKQTKTIISFSTAKIREYLLKEYEREIPIVLWVQSFRNTILDWYMSFASLLGEETCYILLLPITCWIVSRSLAIELTLMLALSIGLGNMLKNTFLLPRPPHPQCWTNTPPQKDHGLPSTHTSSSIAIQFYYFLFYYHVHSDHIARGQHWFSYGVALALVLFSIGSVMISRLYNGHHTPMDVAAGTLIGSSIVASYFLNLRPYYVALVLDNSYFVPIIVFLCCCIMLVMHPQPKTPTPAYPETGLVVGTFYGSFFGLWLVNALGTAWVPDANYQSPYWIVNYLHEHTAALMAARVVIGVTIVFIVKTLAKKLYYYVYNNFVASINNNNNKDGKKKSVHIQPMVEAFGKLFTYSCVSMVIVLSGMMFYHLNISLPIDYQWDLKFKSN